MKNLFQSQHSKHKIILQILCLAFLSTSFASPGEAKTQEAKTKKDNTSFNPFAQLFQNSPTKPRKIQFSQLEIADSIPLIQQGLMGRKQLCPDCAMLFVFNEPGLHPFWMKNTLIPLDMIFINADGLITNIYQNTQPMNEIKQYWPSENIQFVVEVNAGFSKILGLKAGQKLDMQHLKSHNVIPFKK